MRKAENNFPCLVMISGPTASGKTDLSEKLAKFLPSEIINADTGQFFTPLCVGTAKPDWKNKSIEHHLFDVIDSPYHLSVFEYRKLVLKEVNKIFKKGRFPIMVGGSLFYLKSLYFPPKDAKSAEEKTTSIYTRSEKEKKLWKALYDIDQQRAMELHPHDTYRIKRALEIWEKTGIKPCGYKPVFCPHFHTLFVFIRLAKNDLEERINQRTEQMIKHKGWIKEVKKLVGTEWEEFLKRKGLIGYPQIFEWIKKGEREADLPALIALIQQKTRQYAKKQLTFWKSFRRLLQKEDNPSSKFICKILEIEDLTDDKLALIIESLRELLSLTEK